MWKSKEKKNKERLNQSVCGVTITIEVNLSNLDKPISLEELKDKWRSNNCVTRLFNIQVFKGSDNKICIVSPANNELTDNFNINLPDKIDLVENSSLGTVDILAEGNPVGFFKITDLTEVITGSPSLDRSNTLAAYSGIELEPISECIPSSNGRVEISYNVTAFDIGANFKNSITKVSMSAIK